MAVSAREQFVHSSLRQLPAGNEGLESSIRIPLLLLNRAQFGIRWPSSGTIGTVSVVRPSPLAVKQYPLLALSIPSKLGEEAQFDAGNQG